MPVQQIVLLATTYTTLVVIMAKDKLVLHIIGGAVIFLHSLIYGNKGAMFANSNFDIAQSPCIDLYCPTSFGILAWQACNVPMRRIGYQSLTLMCYVPHQCSATPHHKGSSHNPFQNQIQYLARLIIKNCPPKCPNNYRCI